MMSGCLIVLDSSQGKNSYALIIIYVQYAFSQSLALRTHAFYFVTKDQEKVMLEASVYLR